MRRAAVLWAISFAGCIKTGGLDLELSLPTDPDLTPTGMTSISVVASSPDLGTVTNTSLLDGTSFTAGDLPVDTDVQIDVLFHDASSRLVGVGEAQNTIDIVGDQMTTLSIPVRRPFVYASSGTTLYSYDPTLDARDPMFQGTLSGVTAPQLAISVGGDRLAVASTNSIQVVETATNMVTGGAITIPGTIHDAAPVPGTHQLAVAHSAGISVVDLDTGDVLTSMGASVDRVTVGPNPSGSGMIATGLVGRVAPPSSTEACTGTSSLVTTDVASPIATLTPVAQSEAIADVAASPDTGELFVALPCTGAIASVSGTTFTTVSMLSRAAVLTVSDQRVWAVGTAPSMAQCASGNNTVPCSTGATADCSKAGAEIVYVSDGAHLIVQSIPTGSGTPVSVDVPEPRETIISTDDPGGQHAQVLKALAMTPVDLVALPGGQYVGIVLQTRYFIQSLVNTEDDSIILPCLDVTTGDWQLFDMSNTSVAQRVRTQCQLTIGPTDDTTIFKGWACDDAPVGQQPITGQEYIPISVGALFGSR